MSRTEPEINQAMNLAAKITAEAVEVRAKIQTLVVGSLKNTGNSLAGIPQVAAGIFEGACQGVMAVAEDQRAAVLSAVVSGLTDGFTTGAQALKLSLEEAKGRGEIYAADEIQSALEDFKTLEDLFIERFRELSSAGLVAAQDEAGDLLQHAERAASAIHTELQAALQVAQAEPLTLAKESVSVAAGVTRLAAGSLFKSMGKMLDTAGTRITGESKPANHTDE